MCIAKTTTVAQRSLCKLPVKQFVVPLRSKCTTFIEEPIYRPRFKKRDWEQSSLWGKISGRMYDAWQASYFGKRLALGLAFAWYMFQDLENHYVFIDAMSNKFEDYAEKDEEEVGGCSFLLFLKQIFTTNESIPFHFNA
ncbi:hypothetical protein ACH3XW_21450 [Acanthocheilonema viteae]|uniref:Uncharacterized protein n=1 Tax=Acanthocheilonema viteae TaxID=6277 RepID=A0A498SAF7_ACAVI|nr:unnamed protein product [Acanthocheilonema viteae]